MAGPRRSTRPRSPCTSRLPAPGAAVQCAVGAGTTTGAAGQWRRAPQNLTHHHRSPSPPRTPVTLQDRDATSRPRRAGTTIPWPVRWDPVLGDSVTGAAWSSLLAGRGSPGPGRRWWPTARTSGRRRTRCSTPRPTASGRPRRCTSSPRRSTTRGVRRLVALGRRAGRHRPRLATATPGRSPTRAGRPAGPQLDPVTASVAPLLGGPGGIVHGQPQRCRERPGAAVADLRLRGRDHASGAGRTADLARAGLGGLGTLLVIVARAGGRRPAAFLNWLDMSLTALIPVPSP